MGSKLQGTSSEALLMLSLRSASTPRFGRDKIITNSVVCACKIVGYKLCLLETRSGKKNPISMTWTGTKIHLFYKQVTEKIKLMIEYVP